MPEKRDIDLFLADMREAINNIKEAHRRKK